MGKERLLILGTGNAMVKKCYNTCFVVDDGSNFFMVDAGGGNEIFRRLDKMDVAISDLHEIFVTHKHIDHIMGMIWIIRAIAEKMLKGKFEGEAHIYGHDEVISILTYFADTLLVKKQSKLIGERIFLEEVHDGEMRVINGHETIFFDIQSTKAKQFGFYMDLNGKRFVCCGDEPYNPCEEKYAKGADWMLHEAFCLFDQADLFKPYEKHHSTAKDAAELAESLGVKNLVLYHTEEKNLENRKRLYTDEAKMYYSGAVYVPDDLEIIKL